MKALQSILSLLESHGGYSEVFKDLDLWLAVGSNGDLDSADVEVHYDYEGPSYTDHPYGSTTAREHHGASVDIISVNLLKDTPRRDEDGDKVIGELKAGTDLMEQPWWKSEWTEWLAEKINEKMSEDGDDFDEPDDDRDYGDYDRHDDYMSRHN